MAMYISRMYLEDALFVLLPPKWRWNYTLHVYKKNGFHSKIIMPNHGDRIQTGFMGVCKLQIILHCHRICDANVERSASTLDAQDGDEGWTFAFLWLEYLKQRRPSSVHLHRNTSSTSHHSNCFSKRVIHWISPARLAFNGGIVFRCRLEPIETLHPILQLIPCFYV